MGEQGQCVSLAILGLLLQASVGHRLRVGPDLRETASKLFGERPGPEEFASDYGYPVERHEIETDDGYLLTVFRIPGPRSAGGQPASPQDQKEDGWQQGLHGAGEPREPFIVQHGLSMNAMHWLLWKDKGLPYFLADEGFDVWVTNVRGTTFGKVHKTLSLEDEKFWDYSWHEHGIHDMPAIVDYIIRTTGFKQVWYSGHSMGTTMMFVMQSMLPAYSAKIKHFFALSPIAYMGRMTSELKSFCGRDNPIQKVSQAINIRFFPMESTGINSARVMFCRAFQEPCTEILTRFIGRDKEQEFENSFDTLSTYFPSDMSYKQVAHYGQHCEKLPNAFRMFSYSPENNSELYGSPEPPEYELANVKSPQTWIYAKNDVLGVPEDVEEFSTRFPHNPPKMHKIPLESFDHIDFISARDQRKYVAEPLLAYAKEFRRLTGYIPWEAPQARQPSTVFNEVSSNRAKLSGDPLQFVRNLLANATIFS